MSYIGRVVLSLWRRYDKSNIRYNKQWRSCIITPQYRRQNSVLPTNTTGTKRVKTGIFYSCNSQPFLPLRATHRGSIAGIAWKLSSGCCCVHRAIDRAHPLVCAGFVFAPRCTNLHVLPVVPPLILWRVTRLIGSEKQQRRGNRTIFVELHELLEPVVVDNRACGQY